MTASVLAVNVVHALIPDRSGSRAQTAIDKRPVTGRVAVHRLGLLGDTQCDTKHHGGLDQAVYAFASEDVAWWAAELDRELPPGSFGENLTTTGLDISNALVGECWQIGTAVLQVSDPRTPCATFQAFWAVPKLIRRFTEHGVPGTYLRVLTEGEIGAGDEITVIDRPSNVVTVAEAFRGLTGDRTLLARLLDSPGLSDGLRDAVRRRLDPS